MKLYTYCKSCKKEITIKLKASTRPDLQMKKGEEFAISCQNCGKTETKHINNIKAEANKTILLIGVGVGIIVTILLWYYYGAIGTVGVIVPILFWRQEMNAVKAFNSYMIKRK